MPPKRTLSWFSLKSPPGPLGLDTLAHNWPQLLLYAFPLFPLIQATLDRVVGSSVAVDSPLLAEKPLVQDAAVSEIEHSVAVSSEVQPVVTIAWGPYGTRAPIAFICGLGH